MKRKNLRKIVLTLIAEMLFIALLGNLIALFVVPRDVWSLKVVLSNCMYSLVIGFPAYKSMGWFTMTLDRRIPWLKSPIKRLIYQVAGLTLFSAVFIFIGFYVMHRAMGGHDFTSLLSHTLPLLKVVYIFMFSSVILGNTILFFINWKKATLQQEELKRAHLALQYQSLKDQIRPHFLFNSLSSLAALINTDAEKATLFVHKLSDVYRYVLEQRENELVSIGDELKFLKDYIYLQQIRFGENLQVQYKIEVDQNRMVIPLSLQMLVENAIKHNEISVERPLIIEIKSNKENRVIVRNNHQHKEVSEKSLGMGLENLKKQLAFFSDESLVVQNEADTFLVSIPTLST